MIRTTLKTTSLFPCRASHSIQTCRYGKFYARLRSTSASNSVSAESFPSTPAQSTIDIGEGPHRTTETAETKVEGSSRKAGVRIAPRRSYLYVPATTERMLEKSLDVPSDIIIYDLEDSVPPSPADKIGARGRLAHFMSTNSARLPAAERIAVRINSTKTPYFAEDILQVLRLPYVQTIVLPKVHTAKDLHLVSEEIYVAYRANRLRRSADLPVQIVASIESAQAMYNLRGIAAWGSQWGQNMGGKLSALLFAAEDYCADTGIIRTTSRQELLFTRSQIVVAAKAFKLDAIDMVCVNYKDLEYLKDECEDGRRLGFTGKQAIHPSQVDVINSTFVPTSKEILRAAKILKQMEKAHISHKGAAGLETDGGGMEMIDAPMIKQAENVILIAKSAGLPIPEVD